MRKKTAELAKAPNAVEGARGERGVCRDRPVPCIRQAENSARLAASSKDAGPSDRVETP